MQTIKFDNTGYQPIFTLFRGGTKTIKQRDYFSGVEREVVVGADKYNRREYDSWDRVESGFIFTVNDLDRVCVFFGFDKNAKRIFYKDVDLNLCFTNVETFILFKKNSTPKPIEQSFNKRTKTYKEFVCHDIWHSIVESPKGKLLKFWKFKSKNDFIVGNLMVNQLKNLIPELVYDSQNSEIRAQLNNPFENASYKCEILYDLGIIDLNSSWDFTDEYKNKVISVRLEAENKKRKRELEKLERMRTPGYCCRCGEPHANWVYDPYDYEMNGIKNYMWLCPECEEDSAMSV